MYKYLLSISLIMLILLSGCAIGANVRARNDMEMSKAAYKKCLELYPEDLSKCEALKRAYEADLKAYRATSEALKESSTVTIEK